MTLLVNIAPGELIDKITILEIKLERIGDPAKLRNVRHEYDELTGVLAASIVESPALINLRAELKAINETIWQVEDDIRDHERGKDFGPTFIELARAVYFTNDKRAVVKRQINELLDSALIEEKSYAPY